MSSFVYSYRDRENRPFIRVNIENVIVRWERTDTGRRVSKQFDRSVIDPRGTVTAKKFEKRRTQTRRSRGRFVDRDIEEFRTAVTTRVNLSPCYRTSNRSESHDRERTMYSVLGDPRL